MITYKLKINYQEARVLNSDMEFVTGDIGAYRLEFEFYDNGSRDNLAGKLLTVRARRADGVCYASNGEIVDNIGVFVPKNNIYAVPGDLCLEIALSDSAGNYATTKIITASVIDGIGDVANGAQDDVSIYVTLLAQIKAQIDEANKLVDRANLSIDSHTEDKANPHGVTKAQVGLSNVDNTKDADKPVSTATQAALDLKANAADVYTKTEINSNYTDNYGLGELLDEKAYSTDVADDILNAEKHILYLLSGRLLYKGEVEAFANLPTGRENCDCYRLKTGCMFSNDAHSELITGNFSDFFEDVYGDGESFNAYPLYTNTSYSGYFSAADDAASYHITYIYDRFGKYIYSMAGDTASGWPKSDFAPLMTGEDTVAFYIAPAQTTFYTVSDLGLVFNYDFDWYPVADAGWIDRELGGIESALDGILSIQNALIGGGSV